MARLAIEESKLGKHATANRARQNAEAAYSAFMRQLPRAEVDFTLSDKIEVDRKHAELERLVASFGETQEG